jgi:phosphoglycerate dehydrogenase-like enzyme
VTPPHIAIGPDRAGFAENAVAEGGGQVVKLGDDAEALVWLSSRDVDGLRAAVEGMSGLRWVQLPFAGIENVIGAGLIDSRHVWTCAKGSYAQPVAEHALMLALAGLRLIPERVVARSWGSPGGTSLHGAKVAILGGGGIGQELLRLLEPFSVEAVVVRRGSQPLEGAAATVGLDRLHEALDEALVVFVALALTPETTGVIGKSELEAMSEKAWLVNVARGPHVVTDALVEALQSGSIAGAALDVTDPEPLPDGHPLWDLPNCIITPHTADTWEMVVPLLADRIKKNVALYIAGQPLEGVVDPVAGY